ncbi:hypothetical protein WSM22_01260 [Cytophagales bacterium WSM2-2]|nr:hypothetical protein WSM22_01260 [Cytophagales bacterium WSM2-2]
MWGVGSCIKEPTYSVVPDIKFLNLEFKKGTTDDTLTFTLKFTDGDGDLGVDGTETALGDGSIDIDDPYYFVYDTVQKKILGYIHDNNASLPKYGPNLSYVNYKAKRKIHLPAFDTLPALTCKNWQIRNSPLDTLYFQKNYNTYNFFVDVYTKNSNGTYTYFDPALYFPFGQNCVSNFFYGRFPVLSTDLGKKSPLDGTITYKVASAGLYLIFHNQTLKYRIYIMDRALHKSNVVETEYKY